MDFEGLEDFEFEINSEAAIVKELAESCREYLEKCQQGSVELTDRLIRACEILGIELDLNTLTALITLGPKRNQKEMDLQTKMIVLGWTAHSILGNDGKWRVASDSPDVRQD